MLTICLKVLSIIGIVLLCLLGLLLFLVLLILFSPVTYRIGGLRSLEEAKAWVKVRWIPGILRVDYRYPKPNRLVVRFLFFILYDSGAEVQKGSKTAEPEDKDKSKQAPDKKEEKHSGKTTADNIHSMEEKHSTEENSTETKYTEENKQKTDEPEPDESIEQDTEMDGQAEKNWWDRLKSAILAKIVKIKYTFLKIYDKIINILKNIDDYRELLTGEETRELYLYAKARIRKVLKNIRPRKVRADIQFGTGSPDTTGYAIGIYGMLSSFLGKHINIVPNFEEAVLLGEFYVAGHVTGWVLLLNALSLFLDKKLRRFLKRIVALRE